MTAKIKLNAASGGGSISIQAPSSSSNNRVISLPDIADGTLVTSQSTLDATKLSGNLPAISGAALTGISAGIEMAQQWRLTSVVQGNQTPLTNWEAIDTYGQGNVGSAMSVSSGVFTYPTTGIYLVIYFLVGYSDNHSQNIMGYIEHTTNNSNYNNCANGLNGIYDMSNAYSSWANTATMYMFDITDTSNQKTRFIYGAGQGGEYVLGDSNTSHTTVTFIRLAAT